jgi:hypothetical protein
MQILTVKKKKNKRENERDCLRLFTLQLINKNMFMGIWKYILNLYKLRM